MRVNDRKAGTKGAIAAMVLLGAALCANLAIGQPPAKSSNDQQVPKRARYLLLDSRIVDSTTNAVLRLGTPRKDSKNPLFGETWEGRFDNPYAKVIYDQEDNIYKCWYSIFVSSEVEQRTPREDRGEITWTEKGGRRQGGVCYAYSKDGVSWIKPELGLIECGGSKKNNIVISAQHGVEVMKDLREQDPQKRYKAILPARGSSLVWFSPDGIHWKEQKIQGIDHGDTHNCVFWDESIGKYVLFTRTKDTQYGRPLYRQVSRTVSDDFIHWEKPEMVFQGRSAEEQFHDLIVFPHAGVYIGLIGLFDMGIDRQYGELAWSPDGKDWRRIEPGKAFLPNGPEMGDYDWGCIFPAAPIFNDGKTIIYYGANNNRFFGWRDGYMARATLRPDGFAGYEQERAPLWKPDRSGRVDDKAAYVVTKPVCVTGNTLCITADVVPCGGYVEVKVIDAATGKQIAQAKRIKNTATDGLLEWKGREEGFSLENLKGKDIVIQFKFQDAKVFSFVFK